MLYRPEIDGLRAIAVLPVIFFHAGFPPFTGGFLGVDVFFVISGYLITSIILAELEDGSFSLGRFYERRARRILPPLFLVMAACVPFAWRWLLPSELEEFAQSVIAVSVFGSNILFWLQTGYFNTASEFKPLLHTWSLAVEEQYYVLFPIFMILAWRLGRKWIVPILCVTAALSLLVAHWGSTHMPAATFFLLPTRGWELLVGSLSAFYLQRPRWRSPIPVAEVASMAGLAMVLGSFVAFNHASQLPSAYSLLPTLGTALIIVFASSRTVVGKLLSTRTLVGIGLISYSAYLWHQPLFVFARHRIPDSPTPVVYAILAIASLGLAFLSWKYVERPFRNRSVTSLRTVAFSSVFGFAVFVTASAATIGNSGFVARFTPAERHMLESGSVGYKEALSAYSLGKCFIDYDQAADTLWREGCIAPRAQGRKVVVFGDSKAAHLISGVRDQFAESFVIDQWTGTSCRPVMVAGTKPRCVEFYRAFMQQVVPLLRPDDLVIVAGSWIHTSEDDPQALRPALRSLFKELSPTGAKVVVVGNTPQYFQSPQHLLVKKDIAADGEIFLRSLDITITNQIVQQETKSAGFLYSDPSLMLCRPEDLLACKVYDGRDFLFFDSGHLSNVGSTLVSRGIRRMISGGK